MLVAPSLEGLLEDEVAICMIGDHNVLVDGTCPNLEPASVVGVQLAEGIDLDKDFIGWADGYQGEIVGCSGEACCTIGFVLVDLTFWHCRAMLGFI